MMTRQGLSRVDRRREGVTRAGRTGTITKALRKADGMGVGSLDEVIGLVYEELSRLARGYLRREREDHTLDTRALVHEAYARIAAQRGVAWRNRRHFYGIAAQHMRRILCDYARHHQARKRGGGLTVIRLAGFDGIVPGESDGMELEDLLTLDQILERLGNRDPEALEIVNLRCMFGFKMTEISAEMGVPMRTLSRKWRWTRAWLINELRVEESQPPL